MTVEDRTEAEKDKRLRLIRTALDRHWDYYDVEIVGELEPAQADILEVEGCPVSLRKWIRNYNGPYVILRSKLLYCQHVMLWSSLEGASGPIGIKSYCTNFFHIAQMDSAVENLLGEGTTPRNPSDQASSHLYSVEIQICHLLTDETCLWINPSTKISSLKDKTDREFLFLEFDKKQNSSDTPQVFDLKRARIKVKIMDYNLNIAYAHNSNYDLTQRQVPGVKEYTLKLVDQQTKNVLTIGVRMGKKAVEGPAGFIHEDEMTLLFLKYEFREKKNDSREPVASPMISSVNMPYTPGMKSPLQAPVLSSQQDSNTSSLSWLRTPGTQVLKPPGQGTSKPLNDLKLQNQYPGPDTLFGLEQNSPPLNGLSGAARRQGVPPMTLTSPNLLTPLNGYNSRTGNMIYNQYPSPNFQYLQNPMMGLPSSPLIHQPRPFGMMGSSAMGFPQMNPLASQFNSMGLDTGLQMGFNSHQVGNRRNRLHSRRQDTRTSLYEKNDGDRRAIKDTTPRHYMLSECVGKVVLLAKSQSGSRFVQEKLNEPEYFNLFYNELKVQVADLMMDNFGHYAIEALFAVSDNEQRLFLVMNLAPSIAVVSCHKQGSFSIQAMMDTLQTQSQIEMLVEALSKHVMQIILNCSGHYVILRFLSKFGWPYTRFVHRALVGHCYDFSTDHYGLRVMKAAVDAGPHSQLTNVFNCIVKHTNTLVENQYGNYIIQHLLDVCPAQITSTIKEKLSGKYVRYSKQKFSSNVVEKVIRHSNKETERRLSIKNSKKTEEGGDTESKDWREIIVQELCTKADDLISDKYGNYCLQTALQSATHDPELLSELIGAITPHLDSLRENVRAKWNKLLESARVQSNHANHKNKIGDVGGNSESKHKSELLARMPYVG
jgi:hypothetical protein